MKIAFVIIVLCLLVPLGVIMWLGYSTNEKSPNEQSTQTQSEPRPQKYNHPSLNEALKIGFFRVAMVIRSYRDEIIAVGTIFLALFTIVLALTTGFLYDATRDLVDDAKKTAERQLRSYVYIFPVSILRFKAGTPPLAMLSMKNYGQTPVRNGRVKFGFAIAPSNSDQDYTVSEEAMITSKQPIGFPFTGTEGAAPLRLSDKDTKLTTDDEITKVYKERHVIVLKGTFIYDDIFKIERHSHFCYAFGLEQLNAVQGSADRQVVGTSGTIYCKYGNEED